MGKTIPELPAFSYMDFDTDDCIEVSDMSDRRSSHTTLKDISDYIVERENYGFRGTASSVNGFNTLDDFTWQHVGVWRYDGDCAEINLENSSGALVEIVAYSNPVIGDTSTASQIPTVLLQRITYGPSVYHRFKNQNGWTDFYRLSNVNGNIIDSGTIEVEMGAYTNNGTVKFTDNIFAGYADGERNVRPSVIISLEDSNTTDPYIYFGQITYVGWDGFDYDISTIKYSTSDRPSITSKVEKAEVKATGYESVTTHSYISNINGAWKGSSRKIKLHYIATLEIV